MENSKQSEIVSMEDALLELPEWFKKFILGRYNILKEMHRYNQGIAENLRIRSEIARIEQAFPDVMEKV